MKRTVESLLSLKEWNEEAAKAEYARAFQAHAAEEEKLRDLQERYARELMRLEETRGVRDAGAFLAACEYLSFLVSRIEEQFVVVEEKARELEEARKKLVEATKEKKAFEKLSERLAERERAEARRAEQAFMDDVAGKRWNGGMA